MPTHSSVPTHLLLRTYSTEYVFHLLIIPLHPLALRVVSFLQYSTTCTYCTVHDMSHRRRDAPARFFPRTREISTASGGLSGCPGHVLRPPSLVSTIGWFTPDLRIDAGGVGSRIDPPSCNMPACMIYAVSPCILLVTRSVCD